MRPYKGVPELKQLPASKENYKGKNDAGGRKAAFSQSREYKINKLYVARRWGKEGPYRDPRSWDTFRAAPQEQ